MEKHDLAELLGKLRFSATLPEDLLERLATAATLRSFPAGTMLFREGSRNDEFLIVTIGRVALDMNVPGRGNTRILSLGPGDMIAWSALLGDRRRMTTSATAMEDTQAVSISADEVLAVCERNHTFGYFLMRQVAEALAERLVATRLQLLDLFADSTATPS